LIATPALLRSHRDDQVPASTVAKQWRNFFETGKARNPPIAAATATAFLYLAWSIRSGKFVTEPAARNISALYGTATVLTLGIVPFTAVFMRATNNALVSKANMDAESANKSGDEIERLVNKWTTLNAIRSTLPLAGSILGITAAFL
jgi:hypothetical protein